MQIVTPKQMSRLEERSEKLGVSKRQLMENAGEKLAELIENYCTAEAKLKPEYCSVVFLAGTGNNGGDCFAAADILVYKGYRITIIHIGGLPKTPLAQEMLSRLPRDRITFIEGFRSGNVEAAIEAAELDYMTIQPRSSGSSETHSPVSAGISLLFIARNSSMVLCMQMWRMASQSPIPEMPAAPSWPPPSAVTS